MTARDLVGLNFVAEAQPVTTAQVAQLLGLSTAMARRRARIWRDLRLVRVHVPRMAGPNFYTLTPKGRGELARALGSSPEEFRSPRSIGRVKLGHHSGAVDLHVAALVGAARSHRLSLHSFVHEREIRRKLGAPAGAVVPDAAAVFEHCRWGRLAISFEVDCATEQPSWFVRHKVAAYAELFLRGAPLLNCRRWAVCCVVPSERRRNRLASAAWAAGVPEGLMFFAEASAVEPRTIFTRVWWTGRELDTGASLALESPFETVISKRDHGDHGQGQHFSASKAHSRADESGRFGCGERE